MGRALQKECKCKGPVVGTDIDSSSMPGGMLAALRMSCLVPTAALQVIILIVLTTTVRWREGSYRLRVTRGKPMAGPG